MENKEFDVNKFMTDAHNICKIGKYQIEVVAGNLKKCAENNPKEARKQLDNLMACIIKIRNIGQKVLANARKS